MFSNNQLQAMIRGERIGDVFPYADGSERDLNNYLKQIAAELERMKISCENEPQHFGSGYASYIQWLCYDKEHVVVKEEHSIRREEIDGLVVLISSLAPVILIGPGHKNCNIKVEDNQFVSGSSTMLFDPVQLEIPPKFEGLRNQIERLFMKYHYTVLRKEDVEALLPFEATIPTIARQKGKYLVWDAIFYWTD